MNPNIIIRNEKEADIDAIAAVTIAAFQSLEISNHTEQFIIEALRSAKALTVSLVAELNGRVAGHIAFSPVTIADGTRSWYGLGPVSVLPEYQRRGIGKALIGEGLVRLKELNARGCCLVGHPDYYRRLGFKNMSGLVHAGVPQEVFLALSFDGHIPQGEVIFHEAFKADGPQEGAGNDLLRDRPSPCRTMNQGKQMFAELDRINERPEVFRFYTAGDLWTDAHTSKQMLSFHLDESIDVSSRSQKFIDRSVAWIASHFSIGKETEIADFGCGPGLYATRLAKHGAHVTGIDFSERSIEYARSAAARERLNICYVNQNYLEFDTEARFDLVLMIMCDFCALSPGQRNGLLQKFHKLLTPGGSVLLDVYSLTAFDQREETATYAANLLDGFWSPNKYYGFLNTFKYEEEKVSLDKYTIIESDRSRTIYNWLQYFTPEDLAREFTQAGFSVTGLYSDVAGRAYKRKTDEFAVIAAKTNPIRSQPGQLGAESEKRP